MAVEIIDLTSSPPPPIVVNTINEITVTTSDLADKEGKTRKKSKGKRREVKGQEDRARWQHDRYTDEFGDAYDRGEKRKRNEEDDDWRRRKKPERSPSPFFIVDTAPAHVTGGLIPMSLTTEIVGNKSQSMVESGPIKNGLLLPAHVLLSAGETQSIPDDNPPLSPVSEASGIDFVDDDRAVGAPRYFDDRATNTKTHGPCKRCGDSDHDFKHCTVMICLTCGARDEHSSRSCPILRFCWNCKGKGHLARNCPRIGNMDPHQLDREDCERCGSWKHHGTNCPTIWRIYTYLTDTERDTVLANRESKCQLGFDNGGEGYIARDAWCYNCGKSGHLGDDCEAADANYDKPNDYSAFGSYNQLTGPFASPSSMVPDTKRAPREWELDDRFDDGYGFSAQTNVGRKGRENAKAKAREAQRVLDEADDEPDWFNRNQAASKRDRKTPPSKPRDRGGLPPKPAQPTIQLGFQKSSSSRAPWDPSPTSDARPPMTSRPSLRDRIDLGDERGYGRSRNDGGDIRPRDPRQNSGETRSNETQRSHGNRRGEDRNNGREADRNRANTERKTERDRRSRWRGGYDR